jgi:hypothetical protein
MPSGMLQCCNNNAKKVAILSFFVANGMSLGLKFCLTEWDGKMEIREGEDNGGGVVVVVVVVVGVGVELLSLAHSLTHHSSLTHYLFVEVVLTFQVKVGAVG